jgi:hypothetical protein
MHPAGKVVRWDAGQAEWRVPPTADVPFFMRRPAFKPLDGHRRLLLLLFATFIVVALVASGAGFWYAATAGQAADGNWGAMGHLPTLRRAFLATVALQAVTQVAILAVFVAWVMRAHGNLASIGAKDLDLGVASFAPILLRGAGVAMLYGMLAEAWKAADPSLAPDASPAWTSKPQPRLILIWFFGYLLFQLLVGVAWLTRDESTFSEVHYSINVLATVNLFLLPLAITTVHIVNRVTARLEARDRAFDLPSGLAALPAPAPHAGDGMVTRRRNAPTAPPR